MVRALYRILNTLLPVALKTTQIKNATVAKMRDCLLQAASPEELLFVDLPRCFGLKPFEQGEKREKDINYFFEQLNSSFSTLRNHAQNLLRKNTNLWLRKCGLPGNMNGWHELERRATWLAPRVKHDVLIPFRNCVNIGIADRHNARSALSLITNRPFEQWTDVDI